MNSSTTTTTPSFVLAEAIHLNDCAVALLAQGQTTDSTKVFQIALRKLRSGLSQIPSSSSHYQQQGQQPETVLSREHHKVVQPLALSSSYAGSDTASSPNNAFCVYKNAFVMNPSCTDGDQIAMVILFNLALTMHLEGLGHGKTTARFASALRTYEMVSNLLETVPLDENGTTSSSSGWRLLYLATWTNIGHLYSHFVRVEDVTQCGLRLSGLLAHCSGNERLLAEEDAVFFHHTVFYFYLCRFERLAAAA